MADGPELPRADPFRPPAGRFAAVARRLGCSEGQLWSMLVTVLFAWTVSANGLTGVVWGSATSSPSSRSAPVAAPEVPATSPTATVEPPAPALPGLGAEVVGPAEVGPASSAPISTETAPTPPSEEGVRVLEAGFASAGAGTPLATAGVPTGSVAVGRAAGQASEIAYLRLAGSGPTLELAVDPNGASTFEVLGELVLCVVTDRGWKVGHGDVAPAAAPRFDCTDAVPGRRSPTGDRWTFDVARLGATEHDGVAILPSPTAVAPQFRIVFRGSGGADRPMEAEDR